MTCCLSVLVCSGSHSHIKIPQTAGLNSKNILVTVLEFWIQGIPRLRCQPVMSPGEGFLSLKTLTSCYGLT